MLQGFYRISLNTNHPNLSPAFLIQLVQDYVFSQVFFESRSRHIHLGADLFGVVVYIYINLPFWGQLVSRTDFYDLDPE